CVFANRGAHRLVTRRGLYTELARLTHSPVVELNRAVAVAEAGSPPGRARDCRPARARRLPVPVLDARRVAAAPRPWRGRARRVHSSAAARRAEPERRFLERRLAEF